MGRMTSLIANLGLGDTMKSNRAVEIKNGLASSMSTGGMHNRTESLLGKHNNIGDMTTALDGRASDLQRSMRNTTNTKRHAKIANEQDMITNAKTALEGTGDGFGAARTKLMNEHADARSAADKDLGNHLKDIPGAAMDYFGGEGFKTGAIRAGVVGGAYMGAAAGARYMSGGSLSTNNQGQRDIAGIPFL